MQDLKIGLFIVRFVDTYCEFQTPVSTANSGPGILTERKKIKRNINPSIYQ